MSFGFVEVVSSPVVLLRPKGTRRRPDEWDSGRTSKGSLSLRDSGIFGHKVSGAPYEVRRDR